MFTPSIVFLMMLNTTVAASGAVLFALQLCALETRYGLPPSTALASDDAEITNTGFGQEETFARAA